MSQEGAYRGTRIPGRCLVMAPDGKMLPLRLDIVRHSPEGFEWGYAGSGPAQLALALLAHATDDDAFAAEHYETFKAAVVGHLSKAEWTLTREAICGALLFEGVSLPDKILL